MIIATVEVHTERTFRLCLSLSESELAIVQALVQNPQRPDESAIERYIRVTIFNAIEGQKER